MSGPGEYTVEVRGTFAAARAGVSSPFTHSPAFSSFLPPSAASPFPSPPSTPAAVASALGASLPSLSGWYANAPPPVFASHGTEKVTSASYGDLPFGDFTSPGFSPAAASAPITTEVELASLGLPGL